MDLKTFVRETLTQIAEGVNEAHTSVQNARCSLVRGVQQDIDEHSGMHYAQEFNKSVKRPVSVVDFNVVLSESSNSDKGGGFGVLFGAIAADAHREKRTETKNLTSVAFQVYLSL